MLSPNLIFRVLEILQKLKQMKISLRKLTLQELQLCKVYLTYSNSPHLISPRNDIAKRRLILLTSWKRVLMELSFIRIQFLSTFNRITLAAVAFEKAFLLISLFF